MQSERWRQIEDLFHAALDREPALRPAFLENACGSDTELRGRVEALLRQDAQSGVLLNQPIEQIADDVLAAGPAEADLPAGSMVGPYRIGERLGAGGMGQVYQAQDTRLRRTVAIKTLKARFTERFQREAQAISALNHPHICTLYDVGSQDGIGYLVMEHVDGVPLKGPLPVKEALRLAIQIASALEAAHGKGILHRDLKPGNILVSKSGAKLLDFGLAKFVRDESRPVEVTVTASVTVTGQILGTVAYMSPEQVEGRMLDARSDIFSFGLVLCEMLTGRRAFEASSQNALMAAILKEDPPPLETLQPSVPAALVRTVNKCLEKDPARRWQTAADLRHELEWIAEGGSAAPKRAFLPWTIAAAAVILLFCTAGYLYLRHAPKLTDKDTIVLADFENKTGDPVFDETLRQGLAVQLEQSPFLSLISDQNIHQMLGLMGQPADARLTPELAKEVCERTASAAVLDGSITSFGSRYVLGLRARNCRTGDALDDEQETAARKEDILSALSNIASKFRTKAGESLVTVKKFDAPLEEVTTSKLEALKAYSLGLKVAYSTGFASGLPLLKRAVEIDPEFAKAYAHLGIFYGSLGEFVLGTESITKAYHLGDRVSERERYFIGSNYNLQVTGNLEEARQICELWALTYPRDKQPHGCLASIVYQELGMYEKSIEQGKVAIGIDPYFAPGYINQIWSNLYLDRLEEAGNALQRASERNLEPEDIFVLRYYIAFLKDDKAGMERALALAQGKPVEDRVLDEESFALAYSGHLREARDRTRRAVSLAQQAAHSEKAAIYESGAAIREAFFGNAPEARQRAQAATALSKNRDVEYGAAFALALAGDPSRTQKFADELETRFPEDTEVRFIYVPTLRAVLALHNGDARKAIELLQPAKPYDLAVPASWFGYYGFMYPAYVRGESYLVAHQYAGAAAEFQRILDHRGLVFCDPVGAMAQLELGRTFREPGDKAKAKLAYDKFLALWKDADPDIPLLLQAKAEYARL